MIPHAICKLKNRNYSLKRRIKTQKVKTTNELIEAKRLLFCELNFL